MTVSTLWFPILEMTNSKNYLEGLEIVTPDTQYRLHTLGCSKICFDKVFESLTQLKYLDLKIHSKFPSRFFSAFKTCKLEEFAVCFKEPMESYEDIVEELTKGLACSYDSLKYFGFMVQTRFTKSWFPPEIFTLLGELISKLTSLKDLRLWSDSMTCSRMQLMFERLTHMNYLKNLSLNLKIAGTHITEVQAFSNFAGQQTRLQTLTIVYVPNNVQTETFEAVTNGIKQCTELRELDFQVGSCEHARVNSFNVMLPWLQKLEKLSIDAYRFFER